MASSLLKKTYDTHTKVAEKTDHYLHPRQWWSICRCEYFCFNQYNMVQWTGVSRWEGVKNMRQSALSSICTKNWCKRLYNCSIQGHDLKNEEGTIEWQTALNPDIMFQALSITQHALFIRQQASCIMHQAPQFPKPHLSSLINVFKCIQKEYLMHALPYVQKAYPFVCHVF